MAKRKLDAAVREMCRQCTYDSTEPGTALQQVAACTVFTCPLWSVRAVRGTSAPYFPWPDSVTLSIMETLSLSRAAVEYWRDHPYEIPAGEPR